MSHLRRLRSPATASVLALTLSLGLAACSGDSTSSGPKPTPSPTKAAVASDLSALQVTRGDFCDQIDTLVLQEALPWKTLPSTTPATAGTSSTASAPTPATSASPSAGSGPTLVAWTNGDKVNGQDGQDVAHEYGCRWNLPGTKYSAAAWVQAPPVSDARARELTKRLGTACKPDAAAPNFGPVAASTTCSVTEQRPRATVRWAGLFGDAWLVCETVGPQAAERATAFCPALVTALAGDHS